jgi:hypothetical protein
VGALREVRQATISLATPNGPALRHALRQSALRNVEIAPSMRSIGSK